MLFLYNHSDRYWNLAETPSVRNHYELVETDDIGEYAYEEDSEYASNNAQDEEDDWHDHVAQHGGSSKWFAYDPTDPVHIEHKGYEEQRPEHIKWLEAKKQAAIEESERRREARLVQIQKEIRALLLEQEELTNV